MHRAKGVTSIPHLVKAVQGIKGEIESIIRGVMTTIKHKGRRGNNWLPPLFKFLCQLSEIGVSDARMVVKLGWAIRKGPWQRLRPYLLLLQLYCSPFYFITETTVCQARKKLEDSEILVSFYNSVCGTENVTREPALCIRKLQLFSTFDPKSI